MIQGSASPLRIEAGGIPPKKRKNRPCTAEDRSPEHRRGQLLIAPIPGPHLIPLNLGCGFVSRARSAFFATVSRMSSARALSLLGVDRAVHPLQHRGVALGQAARSRFSSGSNRSKDADGPLVEPLGLPVLPLPGQTPASSSTVAAVWTWFGPIAFSCSVERPPQQGLGLVEVLLRDVDQRQRVQALEDGVGILLGVRLADDQGPFGQRLGVGVSP